MNRSELEHAIRAACDVSGDTELYVIGSQAILGQFPNATPALRASIEVDIAPKNRPEAWEEIDGALGELSMFHDSYGFYVQGLEIETAKLPDGWEGRCIEVRAAADAKGLCLEAHDLALAKLAAFRDKDRIFVRTLLLEGMIRGETILARLPSVPVEPEERRSIIESWIRGTVRDVAKG